MWVDGRKLSRTRGWGVKLKRVKKRAPGGRLTAPWWSTHHWFMLSMTSLGWWIIRLGPSAMMLRSSSVMMTAISISLSVDARPVISQSIQTNEGCCFCCCCAMVVAVLGCVLQVYALLVQPAALGVVRRRRFGKKTRRSICD